MNNEQHDGFHIGYINDTGMDYLTDRMRWVFGGEVRIVDRYSQVKDLGAIEMIHVGFIDKNGRLRKEWMTVPVGMIQ